MGKGGGGCVPEGVGLRLLDGSQMVAKYGQGLHLVGQGLGENTWLHAGGTIKAFVKMGWNCSTYMERRVVFIRTSKQSHCTRLQFSLAGECGSFRCKGRDQIGSSSIALGFV